MNENIDLTEILKDCPIGWKFYSSVYGEVEFLGVLRDYISLHGREDEWCSPNIKIQRYPIQLMTDSGEYCVSREGRHRYSVGECTFFPSREQRDWSKFTAPWLKKERFDPKTLKAFDKVLVNHDDIWKVDFFSHICQYEPNGWCQCIGDSYYICIPYNDDTKHLIGTKDEAPEFYRYWED